ncbi:hypothetical protein AWM70_15570 [Paenibacillus yonginensis]|uniref:Uncharacterized protein n=2 Tax=Paenibacillus yonginensis TaxID=1462996 RepID=A0A1B1N349_9BACL|nr:hypothetical protein AWM70_15570 [Paenibacillus yonginensis]
MLSLWILLLGLTASTGQPDVSVTPAAAGLYAGFAGLGSQQTALWTQPSRTQALDSYSRKPEKLRLESFQTLNGVSLDWSREQLLQAKGSPDKIVKDEITGYTEYRYPDVTAGLYEDAVYYVHVDAIRQGIRVNGQFISLKNNGMNPYFGEPDYRAEDGDVYIRQPNAVKIYRGETGLPAAVDLFNEFTS